MFNQNLDAGNAGADWDTKVPRSSAVSTHVCSANRRSGTSGECDLIKHPAYGSNNMRHARF
jgi:hypothetical protein